MANPDELLWFGKLRGVRVLNQGAEVAGSSIVRTLDFYNCVITFDPISSVMTITPSGGGGGGGSVAFKNPVRVATTANISLTGLQTIDGVSLSSSDRVLVKNQTTGTQNGIYIVSAGAWTRAPDATADGDFLSGMLIAVQEGSANGDRVAMLTSNAPITVGTTSMVFDMTRVAALTAAAPAAVTKAAASAGTASDAARADHKHDVSTASTAATAVQAGGAAAEGSATTLARSDHIHQVDVATPVDVGTANAPGSAVTLSRSDHVHNTPYSAVQTAIGGASSALSVNNQKITNVATPTSANDATNKTYVDSISAGLDPKDSVAALSNANLSSLSGTAQTVDGVALNAANMRVLLTAQTTASQNGIWLVQSGAWTRPADFATGSNAAGAHTFVERGTVFSDTGWVCTSDTPSAVVDTNNLTWTQFTGLGALVAGNGLTKTGNQVDVVPNADGSIVVHADDVQVGVLATDAQHGNRGGGGIHAVVTTSVNGFMSAADKTKLDGITGTGVELVGKAPVRAASTANLTLSGTQTIDGVACIAGDRVLAKNQTTASQNGIYVVAAGTWARSTDADANGELVGGMLIPVSEGTVNGDRVAILTTNDPITIGTTSLTFDMSRLPPATATAPNDVTKAAASVGTSTEAARADHKHDVTTATPVAGAVVAGGTAAEGTASTLARSDHLHTVGVAAPVDVGTANSAGSASTLARSDHVHNVPSSAVQAATAALASSISVNNQKIINVATPTAANDAANKTYVDSISAGLDPKPSVTALAASNVASLSGLAQTVDGVAINTAGMRVLLTAQSSSIQNGIWVVSSGAWTRPADFATGSSAAGAHTFVEQGTIYADTGWVCTTNSPSDVVDTNNLAWSQFSGLGQVVAGNGLTKTGNQIDVIANADGSIVVHADDVQVGVLATDIQHGNRGGGAIHAAVTTSVNGFMIAADKVKLDSLIGNTGKIPYGTGSNTYSETAFKTDGSSFFFAKDQPLLMGRNAANTFDVFLMRWGNAAGVSGFADGLYFGSAVVDSGKVANMRWGIHTGGAFQWEINSGAIATLDATAFTLNTRNIVHTTGFHSWSSASAGSTNPSGGGLLRVSGSPGIIVGARNFDNTGDINVLSLSGNGTTFNDLALGDTGTKGNNALYLGAHGFVAVQVTGANEYVYFQTYADFTDNQIRFGTSPSTGGLLNFANNVTIAQAKDSGGTDRNLLVWTNGNVFQVGSGNITSVQLQSTPGNIWTFGSTAGFPGVEHNIASSGFLSFTGTHAASGLIRGPNNVLLLAAKSAISGDLQLVQTDGADGLILGATNVANVTAIASSSGGYFAAQIGGAVEFTVNGTTVDILTNNLKVGNTAGAPSAPASGGYLYAEGGAGKWLSSSGTRTTFGFAEPHCPRCGADFAHEWESPKYGKLSYCSPCLIDALARAGVSPDEYIIERKAAA